VISDTFVKKTECKGEIEIKNLGFEYDGSQSPVFSDLNIKIVPGEKIAIIGPSGCGKTTLLKVMMGLLNKSAGEILIDGMPLEQFGIKNFRTITASVMQDDVLMSGSILQNICFFENKVDLQRAVQCAELAEIHTTISSLPMAYETLVGDMGSTLSGGQKQRILLARALYKQPKILFLDEATSHLDVAHESKINRAIKALSMTQIVVAHRMETIKMADRVVELKKE
jgi:ATP-binding cassette subfamily B protein RaxB